MARTGRPREFDTEKALDAALFVFWEYGYESTSLAQLREAMGISSASLYAAFSSKDVLFDAVVQRYASGFGRSVDPAADENLSPREAIEETLRQSVRMQTDPSHPSGCLVTLSEVTCVPENQRVRDLLADRRMWTLRCMTECVERAVTLGELPADTEPAALATAFHGFLMGISTQARDRVSQAALDAAVTQVMRLWDSMTVPTAPDSAIRMKPSRNEVKASS